MEGDDVHQFLPLPFLRGVFPDSVLDPIRLHVDAKRYLCYADTGYWETLSPASKRSLELQGGIFDAAGAQAFLRQPHAEDAVLLRRFDDLAKTPGAATPPLEHYAAILRECALGECDETEDSAQTS
jgi:predicted HD phosphohydrolase